MADLGQQEAAFEPPWWQSGQEMCEFCCETYVLEMEYRCLDCDAPICPLCIVTVEWSRDVRCRDCHHSCGEQ